MQIGLIGLGKMGHNMRDRMRDAGVDVVGYDTDPDISDVASLAGLVERLDAPRVVWAMVPAGDVTRQVIEELAGLLGDGDVVVDGGNSHYVDDQEHAQRLRDAGVGFVDCGVSGGVWGRQNGYALMCGGAAADVATVQPAFDALTPDGEFGFAHCGGVGAGHFAKMVHNGIEYAMMQAFAEGWELLDTVDLVDDVPALFNSWRDGTVIRSWLLDLFSDALAEDTHLDSLEGYAEESGEGRWTVQAAIDNKVATPAISAALYARFVSQQGGDAPAMRAISAMRNKFGGHAIKPVGS